MLRLASWHLAPRPALPPARLRCARLARTQHAAARRPSRVAHRCAAEARPGGGAGEAELRNLLTRLSEDDVDYFDLKKMCKERQLGGRDSKENLRAKLLRAVRVELGLPVYGPGPEGGAAPAAAAATKLPQAMSSKELSALFESRGMLQPSGRVAALTAASALLVADGLLDPATVACPDPEAAWSSMTVSQLKQACTARGLPTKGLRADLVQRLQEWDETSAAAAAAESDALGGSIGGDGEAGPMAAPAAGAQLQAVQELYRSMHQLEVGQLREEVARRGQKIQGTRQVLLAKLSEALEREAAAALGGDARLAQWAAAAVGRMLPEEVGQQLAARGVRAEQYGTAAEAAAVLQAAMQREWVLEALQGSGGGTGQAAGQAGLEQEAGVAPPLDAYGALPGGDDPAPVRPWSGGRPGDPVLSMALLLGGHTLLQREDALAAARLAAHLLQSEPAAGLVPAAAAAAAEGGERSGVVVAALYAAPAGPLLQLTWEQLFGASAAELDLRAALQGGEAAEAAAAQLAGADVVLPLGLPPSAPTLLAPAAGAVVGAAANEAVAALAADRLAFAAAAAQHGFATVPALRLQLAEFWEGAEGAERLSQLPLFRRLEAFAAEHLPEYASPRLAVRAEVAGSVLGGCVVTGPQEALLAALALMQEHSVGEVIVEAATPGARHFTCSVVAGEGGAVALPPTELGYWDPEEDFLLAELDMERWAAAQEGAHPEVIDALLGLARQELAAHPGHVGGPASPSQQLRQCTPPEGLSVEATRQVQQASVKLFQQLGLRDYAQFGGWVLPPPQQPHGVWKRLEEAQQQQEGQQEGPEGQQQQQQQRRGSSFAELQAIDAAGRAEAAAAVAELQGGAADISPADRAGATDTTAEAAGGSDGGAQQGGALAKADGEQGGNAKGTGGDYGWFNGILLDDSIRPTSDEILAEGPFGRPIPEEAPEPVVEALEDLSGASPQQLCALPGGAAIVFAHLGLAPDLACPTSTLCQQAAAVGLSYEALLRHLVAAAAARRGAPALPPLPEADALREAVQAEAAAVAAHEASGEAGWGPWSRLAAYDEAGAAALAAEDPLLSIPSWLPGSSEAASGGEADSGGVVDIVDATQDPSLDPVALMQAQDAAAAADLPLGYDDIRAGAAYPDGSQWDDAAAAAAAADGGAAADGIGAAPRQRVWVLLGGDGAERTQSLQAGLHAYLSLRTDPELEVEAFLLEPSFEGKREVERRRELLSRRNDLLQLGMSDDEILQEYDTLHPTRIRNPPPTGDLIVENLGVWRLSGSGLVRGEVPDLQCACEAALATANASLPELEARGGDLAAAQLSVGRQEAELAGLTRDGSAWGGAAQAKLSPAQYLWAEDFAARARAANACVLLALGGQPAVRGPLQRLLEEAGVPYTGSAALAVETAADKALLLEQLFDLSASGISTPPQQKISLPELAAQCEEEEGADRLFEQLRASLGAGPVSLCIKPAHECGGLGVMRASRGLDLIVYVQAVQSWVASIPGQELLDGAPDVPMPLPPPVQFVVEPWVQTEPVRVVQAADGSIVAPEGPDAPAAAPGADALGAALHWPAAASNEWLAVSATLLGGTGRMRCLGPSITVLQLQQVEAPGAAGSAEAADSQLRALALAEAAAEAEEEEAEELRAAAEEAAAEAAAAAAERGEQPVHRLSGAFHLTPPPPPLATEAAVAAARTRFEMVADRLGLSGAAAISGFMQVQTGELVVADVCTTPDLSPAALIFQQAAASDPPLSPAGVLQELVRVAVAQPLLEEADELQMLGYPELGEEAADFDYPADTGYSPYPGTGPYPDAAAGGAADQYGGQFGEQYGAAQQW